MDEHEPTSEPALTELDGQGSSTDIHPQCQTGISTREAAARLGMTERSVRRAIDRGDLPAARNGRVYRIDLADLERFAARWKQPAWSPPTPQIIPFTAAHAITPPPTLLSPFVGRERELAALAALLRDPAVRLVTLLGPGGIGKTRLAIAAAEAVQEQFPDGVAFVALASVTRPEAAVAAIANALGLREQSGRDPQHQVQSFLKSRQMLLVLDNLEQVLAAAPAVAQILAHAPDVTVLVTSRAPLRLRGERRVPVPPMSGPDEAATPAGFLASDAAQLFVARALEHEPSFEIDEASALDIAGICARLDGLPLAIELAAARVTVLSPRQLYDRLEPRLPLLTGGERDAPHRHLTMRDTIAWSYDLLSDAEQRLFRRLAVFAGGFSLEAAEWISGVPDASLPTTGVPSPAVFDLVSSLVEQNLLVRETWSAGEPRFRMLETMREFGLECLQDHESVAVHAAHAEYYCQFASNRRQLVNTQGTREPLDQLATDDGNLLAALAWLDEHGPPASFARMIAACRIYWYTAGRLHEAEDWLSRALARQDRLLAPDRARLLIAFGELLMLKGDSAQAEAAFASGLPLLRNAEDPFDVAIALISWGASLNYAAAYTNAQPHLEEALALAESITDPRLAAAARGGALSNLGVSARGLGDLALATTRTEDALSHYRGQRLELAETRCLMDLGDIAKDQGNHRLAVERYLATIDRTGERGDMRLVAAALTGIASAAHAWGRDRTALLLHGAADALRERVGAVMVDPKDEALVERDLAIARRASGEEAVAAILREGRAMPLPEVLALAASVREQLRGRPPARHVEAITLTPREMQVLAGIVAGKTDREIAEALFLSPRTVNWHVSAIFGKLGVESRREAIARADTAGLLQATGRAETPETST
jgi:excisionase family DNA binding protein